MATTIVKELESLTAQLKDMIAANATVQSINSHMAKIDDVEARIQDASKMLAWRSKGDAQDQYLSVCEYADQWIDYAGYRFRSYYSCFCGVLVSSKMWPRRYEDMASTKQRRCCPSCERRYKPKFWADR